MAQPSLRNTGAGARESCSPSRSRTRTTMGAWSSLAPTDSCTSVWVTAAPATCSAPGFIPPIADYGHTAGRCSITGGYVYRGRQASLPYGSYIYGDYCSGEIFLLKDVVQTVLLKTSMQISSFGEDEAGEVY